jgi:hypothetical protein
MALVVIDCIGLVQDFAGHSVAASSRSQVQAGTASPAACPSWPRPSMSVRWCPLLSVAVVTHLVTRSLAASCAGGPIGQTTSMRTLAQMVDRGRYGWSGVGSRHPWATTGALAAARVAAPARLARPSAWVRGVVHTLGDAATTCWGHGAIWLWRGGGTVIGAP